MNDTHQCPECGAELPTGADPTPCPACLMQLGMQSWIGRHQNPGPSGGSPTTPRADRFIVPEPEELAKLFPQLEILELLGHGGMGAVYKARQKGLERLVAVKILPAEIGNEPAFAERFAREARALARLNHPNIVSVYDYGQTSGQYYFVMEFVDGANLRQLVRDQPPEPQQALALVSQICDALQFAHDEGIVHRDIKPENILVDRRGRAKIADFGLAKLLDHMPAETALTQDRQAMGTLHYMAPEQMEGSSRIDHRADLYSLGVVFYELLTGELPLGRFALPSRTVHVDVRLDEIVLRSLERQPERRYQRASEIKSAIQTVSDHPLRAAPAGQVPEPVADADVNADAGQDEVGKRLQVPVILMLVAGILNLLPVAVGIPLALIGVTPGAVEILIFGSALPIGVLQILAALLLRNRQGRMLGVAAAALSVLPCGLGWLISVIAGVWTLVVLNDPEVKAAFDGETLQPPAATGFGPAPAAPGPPAPPVEPGPPRYSRKAIVGAVLALPFLLLVVLVLLAFFMRISQRPHSAAAMHPSVPSSIVSDTDGDSAPLVPSLL